MKSKAPMFFRGARNPSEHRLLRCKVSMKVPFSFMVPALVLFLAAAACRSNSNTVPMTATPPAQVTPFPSALDSASTELPPLWMIKMFPDNAGWAMDDEFIYHTRDGGNSWKNVATSIFTITDESNNTYTQRKYLYVLDSNNAWLITPDAPLHATERGKINMTGDGGDTWSTSETPFGEGTLYFLDPLHGWMLANRGAGAGKQALSIFRTEDGGSAWKLMFTNDFSLPNAGDSISQVGLKTGISATTDSQWVYGQISEPYSVLLYRSMDAGQTWSMQSISLPQDLVSAFVSVDDLRFVSAEDAALALHISDGTSVYTMFCTSHDGGDSWTVAPGKIMNGNWSEFPTNTEGYAWNGEKLFHTRDGASTWDSWTPEVDPGDGFITLTFTDVSHGWAISKNSDSGVYALYKTEDGGLTWAKLHPVFQ